MWTYVWHQIVWPNVLRPMLRDHGLQLTANDYLLIATQIEALRGDGKVTPAIVKQVWTQDVVRVIIDALNRL